MRRFWGSLICVVFIVLGILPASADFLEVPEIAPIPIEVDGEYAPPGVFNGCPVAIAGNSVATVANCLPRPNVSGKTSRFVFNDERREELQRVNAEFNAVLADSPITLEESIQIAVGKMAALHELNWPAILLSYGIVELAEGDEPYDVVVLVVLNTRAFVLGTRDDNILPWQLYPHRFVGIESNGTWRPVADNRDDPSYSEIESYCGQHVCQIISAN